MKLECVKFCVMSIALAASSIFEMIFVICYTDCKYFLVIESNDINFVDQLLQIMVCIQGLTNSIVQS